MKKLISLFCVLSFIPSISYGQMNYIKTAKFARKVTVVIHSKVILIDPNGKVQKGMTTCSGVYISPNTVLTAAHCFEEQLQLIRLQTWVRGTTGKSYTVKVIKKDVDKDLALLKVNNMDYHIYARKGNMPVEGQEVLNCGCPLGLEFMVSNGIVGLLKQQFDGFKSYYTVTTATINPGNSGGGVFDSHNNLIGINTMSMGMFGWMGISMAVDINTIREFLKEDNDSTH